MGENKEKKLDYIRDDIIKLLDYLYKDEQDDYYEAGMPDNHIFLTIEKIGGYIGYY